MNIKTVATVILYNPEDDVLENINSYAKDVDTLIVVDNSTKYNDELLQQIKKSFTNSIYINNNGNLGIATALNIACNKAIELGFRWILTMDQDSKFLNFKDYTKCLVNFYDRDDIAIIGAKDISVYGFKEDISKYFDKDKVFESFEELLKYFTSKYTGCEMIEEELIITSGNFLNLSLFKTIGEFNDKLFIDEVDHEYCAKSLKLGYKILKLKNIKFIHALGYQANGVIQHNHIRTYYITRNRLFMMSKYSKMFPEYNLRNTIHTLRKRISRILRKEEDKKLKLKSIALGVFDFLRGQYGKKY